MTKLADVIEHESNTRKDAGLRMRGAGASVLRYGLVLVIGWIGLMKFTQYEARGIQPLVAHLPLTGWMYSSLSVQAFSDVLGVVEVAIAILIGLRHWLAKASKSVGVTCLLALTAVCSEALAKTALAQDFTGALYAGTNGQTNGLVAYGQKADGTLAFVGDYLSGGAGGRLNTGGPIDPLLSAHSVLNVDNRFVLQVNAGSNTVSSFRVNKDFSLTLVSVVPSGGFGPDTIVERDGVVYVANVSSNGVYTGPPDQVGDIDAFTLNLGTGQMQEIPGSKRQLVGRPSDLAIAPSGRSLVVSIYNAGSTAISDSAATAELESFAIVRPGFLTPSPVSTITSTQRNNVQERNLPSAIGIAIRELPGHEVVVVTESREFLANGQPASLSQFQTGSVSTFDLNRSGFLRPISLDVPTSSQITTGPTNTSTSSCWISFDKDGQTFWVVSASSSIISSFRFNEDGSVEEIDSRAATGIPVNPAAANPAAGATGFVDVAETGDSAFLYDLESGTGRVAVYRITSPDAPLTLLQQISTGLSQSGGVMGIAYVQPVP
jgi:6-phosphogluconolactonase (cycloisomerase 2 family)